MPIRHILVATDFSDRANVALRYAIDLARVVGAEVDLLHVVTPPRRAALVIDAHLGRPMPQVDGEVVEHAERSLRDLIASTPHQGVTLRRLVEPGDPAATTVRMATELPSDLIVIGTHGRIGVSELVLGSVAHRVVTCAPCPVVTLRGDEASLLRGRP
jgi:nucleotide-binding universal stress UspA family protein